ncbi:MAG: alpha/beta fold hydrolase [Deltaproteobacteria bacterium]|nr:alpha/beta fold hydrolase [Deltaproteobacteria bacterium]
MLLLVSACASEAAPQGADTAAGTLGAPDGSETSPLTAGVGTGQTAETDTDDTTGTEPGATATTDTADSTGVPTPDDVEPTGVPGPYPVGHTTLDIDDPIVAGRVLPSHIWYPAAAFDESALVAYELFGSGGFGLQLPSELAQGDVPASSEGPFPLVLFSHGGGSMAVQSTLLCETLASHGFVVVAPNHPGSTLSDTQAGTQAPLGAAAADRPRDVRTVLDAMEVLDADEISLLFGLIDEQHVGVAGHSFGGFTALAAAGGYEASGSRPDPRVDAIAPIGASTTLLSQADIAAVDLPTLFVTGTDDFLLESDVVPAFTTMSAQPRYRVDVEGANHYHFANVCDIGQALIDLGLGPDAWPSIGAGTLVEIYDSTCTQDAFPIAEAHRLQNKYVVGFFRAFLREEPEYAGLLTPDHAMACESDVAVWVEEPPVVESADCG